MRGDSSTAFEVVVEQLEGPAPDAWDPNWPPTKLTRALLTRNAKPGDQFVLSNGEGRRGRFRVDETGHGLRVSLVESWYPLGDLLDRCQLEVTAQMARSDDSVEA